MKTVKRKRKRSRKSMTAEADRLVSRKVRARGHCELWLLNPEVRCEGDLQCCHIIGRRYRSTRWDENNLLAGCQGHHVWFTHRPEAWFLAIEAIFPGRYAELYERAQKQWDRDIESVLARLKSDD